MMRILTTGDVRMAPGISAEAGPILADLGSRRPLVVVDPVVHQLGLADKMLSGLRDAGMTPQIFSAFSPDPTDAEAMDAVQIARSVDADCVVGIGGGSAMDVAKAVALLSVQADSLRALSVPRIVDLPALPILCVPTTAGTGSEVTRAAVITDATTHEKLLLLGSSLQPKVALLDVELTLSCPYRVTVDSGLDALSHALEALVNRNATPYSDGLATQAMQLIGKSLETAARVPGDHAARSDMLLGACLAGMAVSHTSTALIHGMSRPIGAAFHVPHGMSNAMLMPLVTEWSAVSAPQAYGRAAKAMGLAEDPAALIDALKVLNARLEVPSLASLGISQETFRAAIPEMARQAIASGTPDNNLRRADEAQISDLYLRFLKNDAIS
ncbi:iron-containing alcohol dehydrogenase [Salipiger sp. HF18]|uniref:iron-containing alcohol dehydrogenase n=1 Tax=Salipiger sp. HF18 TaxID=2721557 RepID=UPI00142DC4EE|nr:iron-containing alcohol dehydrogenase [Salipiger sp. HF18]NIY97426.1 iron-containing alcohol dehydrogenase [Salipiger sp. HF18]